jgi:hypothetical protein
MHVSGCETCSEVEHVVRWMSVLAERVADPSALPNPTVIWLKSRLLEQKLREEHVVSRAVLARAAAWSGLLSAASLSFFWMWPAIDTGMATLETWASSALTATSGEPLIGPLLLAAGLLLLLSLRYILRYLPLAAAVARR